MQKPFTITTSIAYPNAAPHLGFAQELVEADFLARYHAYFHGADVWFQTGTDEHGKKMHRTAAEKGVEVLAYATEMQQVFRDLADSLQINYSRFIRTTDADHQKTAQWLWNQVYDRGFLEKRQYQAWYDVKEEEFLGTVAEYPDPSVFGVDPKNIEKVDESNWFFQLSAFEDRVKELIDSGKYTIAPQERLHEMRGFLERGLSDVSVSRDASAMPWGVPVPGDSNQVMYVWFDALTNYLSGVSNINNSGELEFSTHWPIDIHVVGKDIARFHALLWPAMLMAAGFADEQLPKTLLVHGHILAADGTKMSKSVGNVINPQETLQSLNVAAVRWFLLREVAVHADAPAGVERIRQTYQRDLANGYGNLVSRVISMLHKYRDGVVPEYDHEKAGQYEREVVQIAERQYHEQVAQYRFDLALAAAMQVVSAADERIEATAPWKLAKDPDASEVLDELLYELVELIWHVGRLLVPAVPVVSDMLEILFPGVIADDLVQPSWGTVPSGLLVPKPEPLFPRIDAEVAV